jgi:polyisoprenoid-binding protein YceI
MHRAWRTIAAALLLTAFASPAVAAEFDVDPNHSSVHFAVSHEELSYVHGRFGRIGGTAQFDAGAKTGAMTISVPVTTIDTGNRAIDNVLRSDQFLDAEHYPEMHFVSERFVFEGEKLTAIEGELTLHGVQRPLRLVARRFQCKNVWAGLLPRYVCGGEFQATIKRSEFGMTHFLPEAVGDEVELTIDGEAPQH